ncbi:MAG: GAF domain-containing protein [Cyclobacteriaceae bacterium]
MNSFKSIKVQLIFSFISLIAVCAIGGVVSYQKLKTANQFQRAKDDTNLILRSLSEARAAEKEFLLYDRKEVAFLEDKQASSLKNHRKLIREMQETMEKLKLQFSNNNEILHNLNVIQSYLDNYNQNFTLLVDAYYQRGFKDHGLEGEMRDFVHALQKTVSAEEQVFAFSLRRHEKDFMLRMDPQYIQKLHATANQFKNFVAQAGLPHQNEEYQLQFIKVINAYVQHFEKIVAIETKIGLKENQGLMAELTENALLVAPKVQELVSVVESRTRKLNHSATTFFVLFISIPLLISIFLSIHFTRKISLPIINLNERIKSFLQEHNILQDEKNQANEIKALSGNFEIMLNNIRENLKMVNEKNEKLMKKAKEDDQLIWKNEGIAQFTEIIRNKNLAFKELAYNVISFLVNYTQSNQGSLFVVNDENETPVMELKAAYAFDRKKYLEKEILPGEGIIGACWLEKELQLLTEIPDNYINITSGMGDANPNCILIVPIKNNQEVVGIVELASFHVYEKYQIEFIQLIDERMGSYLAAEKMQEISQKQLSAFQKKSDHLQHDLFRTNAELEAMNIEIEKLNIQKKYLENLVSNVFGDWIICDDHYNVLLISKSIANKLDSDQSCPSLEQLFSESVPDLLHKQTSFSLTLKHYPFTSYKAAVMQDQEQKKMSIILQEKGTGTGTAWTDGNFFKKLFENGKTVLEK